jgi:DNA-binding GntR family transcriptional regulator
VVELDTLRCALEEVAVRQVTERDLDEDIAVVEKAAARMERAEDAHEMVRCDMAFHDAVYAAARHRRLAEAWQAIRSQVHLFLLARIRRESEGYLDHISAEHRELAAALRARDTVTALELFASHRRHAFDILAGDAADPS